jgi:hypothetical protein
VKVDQVNRPAPQCPLDCVTVCSVRLPLRPAVESAIGLRRCQQRSRDARPFSCNHDGLMARGDERPVEHREHLLGASRRIFPDRR